VWVEVLEIYMQGEGGRTPLLTEPTELIELTALTESSLELVDGVELPAGRYSQLRFVVGQAVLETMGGEVFVKDGAAHPEGLETTGDLVCPSCSQSGLKVKLPGGGLDLSEDGYVIMADFDVSQSFGKQAGASGKWVMHPVIHASALESGGSIVGDVQLAGGILLPECPAGTPHDLTVFVPTATTQTLQDGEGMAIIRTGTTKADGAFSIDYLAPDGYDLGYLEQIEVGDHTLLFTADVTPTSETVAAGETRDGVVYTINDVVCQGP
jgi:hypothetical protein